MVAYLDGVVQAALDPANAALKQDRVQTAGSKAGQLGQLQLVEVVAAEAAKVLHVMQQLSRRDVDRELLRLVDHVVGVAGRVDCYADHRRHNAQDHGIRHRHGVVAAAVAAGDQQDGPAG